MTYDSSQQRLGRESSLSIQSKRVGGLRGTVFAQGVGELAEVWWAVETVEYERVPRKIPTFSTQSLALCCCSRAGGALSLARPSPLGPSAHRGLSLPVQSTQRGVQFTICVIKHTKHSDCINKTKLQSISRSQAAPGHTLHALRTSHSYYLHNATQYPVLQRWEKPKFSHWFPHPWTFVHFSSQKG